MRIVILGDSFPPYISGVTTHCVELARWLLKFGHEVLILAPRQPEGKKIVPPGLETAHIVYVRSFPTHYPNLRMCAPNMPNVLLQLRKFKPDIIDTQAPSFLGTDTLAAAKILQVPVVSTFHTLFTSREYLQMLLRINRVGVFEKTSWAYHRWFYNSSDRVFVSTNGMQELLTTHGIGTNKIDIIPMLFEFDQVRLLSPDEIQKIKAHYGLKTKVALFVGRLSKEKALDKLVDIWAHVIKEHDDCSLLIIGGGPYETKLKERIAQAGIADHVVLTGTILHDELISSGIINVADVFVSASTSETFGLTGLEAMAHKVPTILAKSQGLNEIVDTSGFTCDPDDPSTFKQAILKLFADPELKMRMGEQARHIASEFGGQNGAARIYACYEKAIKNYTPRENDFLPFSI